MGRLIQKDEQGNWNLKGVRWRDLYEGNVISKEIHEKLYGALRKLMEYEDTGLSPEVIERVNDFEKTQAAKLLRQLDEERQKHSWISVEERLPESPEFNVLIQVSGKPRINITLENALMLASYDCDGGWILEEYPEWESAVPIAWMPLPELYHKE